MDKNNLTIATFVSVWDNRRVDSECVFNLITNEVSEVEQVNTDGLEIYCLDEEFIELPSGVQIKNFTYNGEIWEDGVKLEECIHSFMDINNDGYSVCRICGVEE